VGFIAFCTIALFLKDKPLIFRVRAAIGLGIFAAACLAALHFLP
jgi:hypothetical protein